MEYPAMTRVLIVDDQPAFRKQLRSVLALTGLEVAGEAGSIREALEILPGLSAHLAVVDVEMPEINGVEGTRLLKKAFPGLRVILVSAYADQAALLKKSAANAGAEAFIPKDRLDPDVIRGWGQQGLGRPVCKDINTGTENNEKKGVGSK